MSHSVLRLYTRYVSAAVRSQLQYRASAIIMMVGMAATIAIDLVGVLVLFDRFGMVKGWSLHEVTFLYGMVHLAFALADIAGRGFDRFPRQVRSGSFDRILLRPRSTLLQVAGSDFRLRELGAAGLALGVLIWSGIQLHVAWTPAKVALLIGSIAGGACLFVALFLLLATLSFWTTETLELMNIFTHGGRETAQYPMAIYRDWFRRFFTYIVPLSFVNYMPMLAITGRPDPHGLPPWMGWLSPAIGMTFLVIVAQLWRIGVRHYRSTGS